MIAITTSNSIRVNPRRRDGRSMSDLVMGGSVKRHATRICEHWAGELDHDLWSLRDLFAISWSRDNGNQGCECSLSGGSFGGSSIGTYLPHLDAYLAGGLD